MGRFLLSLSLLLSLYLTLPLHAQHQVFERGGFLIFSGETFHVYFFNEDETALKMVDEGCAEHPHYGSLDTAMQENNCIAGINGSYFAADTHHSPLGLLITDGKRVSSFASGGFTVTGILYDTGNGIKLERSSKLSTPIKSMTNAMQAGPFLVENGQVIKGLNTKKVAARSFIATDGKGKWCIAMSSAMSLSELAQKLTKKGTLGTFHVQTALNLDGGSSCCFWTKEDGSFIPSYKLVRNYLGLVPRSK